MLPCAFTIIKYQIWPPFFVWMIGMQIKGTLWPRWSIAKLFWSRVHQCVRNRGNDFQIILHDLIFWRCWNMFSWVAFHVASKDRLFEWTPSICAFTTLPYPLVLGEQECFAECYSVPTSSCVWLIALYSSIVNPRTARWKLQVFNKLIIFRMYSFRALSWGGSCLPQMRLLTWTSSLFAGVLEVVFRVLEALAAATSLASARRLGGDE